MIDLNRQRWYRLKARTCLKSGLAKTTTWRAATTCRYPTRCTLSDLGVIEPHDQYRDVVAAPGLTCL